MQADSTPCTPPPLPHSPASERVFWYAPAHTNPSPEMLASTTPIDVVLVLTADQFHAEHVIASANAGKHVLIEKPMAQTVAEADAIEQARVDNGVVVFVGYMRRYATALERLKDAIKGKEIKCGSYCG